MIQALYTAHCKDSQPCFHPRKIEYGIYPKDSTKSLLTSMETTPQLHSPSHEINTYPCLGNLHFIYFLLETLNVCNSVTILNVGYNNAIFAQKLICQTSQLPRI